MDAPVAAGLLAIASAALGEDLYGNSPRTLEAMKLASLDRVAMKKLLHEGLGA
jgi:hypothetical protein